MFYHFICTESSSNSHRHDIFVKMARTMAEETEANTPIRVNSLDPGLVDTALYQCIYPEPAHADLPLPDAVCRPYLFLLGPGSRGLTGQTFSVREGGPWDA